MARVARAHGVNTIQLFGWRRLYLNGRLGEQKPTIKCLPVKVSESLTQVRTLDSGEGSSSIEFGNPKPMSGTIHIELRQAQVRIEGGAENVRVHAIRRACP